VGVRASKARRAMGGIRDHGNGRLRRDVSTPEGDATPPAGQGRQKKEIKNGEGRRADTSRDALDLQESKLTCRSVKMRTAGPKEKSPNEERNP